MMTIAFIILGLGFIIASWSFLQEIGLGFDYAWERVVRSLIIYVIIIFCMILLWIMGKAVISSKGNYLIDKPYLLAIGFGFIATSWGFLQEISWGYDNARENAIKYLFSYCFLIISLAIVGFILKTLIILIYQFIEEHDTVIKNALAISGIIALIMGVLIVISLIYLGKVTQNDKELSQNTSQHTQAKYMIRKM